VTDVLTRDHIVPATAVHRSVTLSRAEPFARYSLRTRDPDGLPGKVLTTAPYGTGTALCIGPDEWLLILPENAAPPTITGTHALTDIGHRNIGIAIDGPKAETLLLTGCALDLQRDFAPGKATRTVYEGVEIILWRTGPQTFHVEVWRSFAAHLWDALDLAAGDLN
jgi:sarcosine oxidase subunit gamma